MDHAHRAGVVKVKQEIAIGNRVERVGDHAGETELLGGEGAIERIGGTCQSGAAQRVEIGSFLGGRQTLEVARELPEVGQEMMAQKHRLRVLQMGVSGQDGVEVFLGNLDERATQLKVGSHQLGGKLLRVQARVGDHLVVSAAARVQAGARVADALGQNLLDGHVNVFVVDVELEIARVDVVLDLVEPGNDGVAVGLGDNALLGKHRGMSFGAGDVLLVHRLVHHQGGAEFLGEFAYARFESSRPQSHSVSLSSWARQPRNAPGRPKHVKSDAHNNKNRPRMNEVGAKA